MIKYTLSLSSLRRSRLPEYIVLCASTNLARGPAASNQRTSLAPRGNFERYVKTYARNSMVRALSRRDFP